MHCTSLLVAFSITVSGALATEMIAPIDVNAVLGFDGGPDNFYNAPIPPWVAGATPGWYYGPNPQKYPDLWCLHDFMCRFLWYYPDVLHCPVPRPTPSPKPTSTITVTDTTTATTTTTTTATVTVTSTSTPTVDGYIPTFSNITAAVQADDFMTFGLVETVADCMAMCDSVPGCTFVNPFHDVNGKGGSTDLTCSLFQFCHTAADADNAGGQSQPDGSVDFIINSDGWCKVGNSTTTTTTASQTPTTSASSTPTSAPPSTTSKTTSSTTTKKTTSTTTTKTSTSPTATGTGIAHYYQCGGLGYTGVTTWYVHIDK
ncbi:hypothetical protein BDZ97DRAFT_1672913 [Flammula alnicola]|nr:hypothetical protein BDZ97DRAFT_1672913 [Flammula alnicola]